MEIFEYVEPVKKTTKSIKGLKKIKISIDVKGNKIKRVVAEYDGKEYRITPLTLITEDKEGYQAFKINESTEIDISPDVYNALIGKGRVWQK